MLSAMSGRKELAARIQRLRQLSTQLTPDAAAELLKLADDHQLRWQVWPERRAVPGGVRQIGFEVILLGVHHEPKHAPYPGCDECQTVFQALRKIAQYALPSEQRASFYELEAYDGALRYDHRCPSGYVALTFRILHRKDYGAPPDPCEQRCLAEIEAKLSLLGGHADQRHLGQVAAS
jgi:hypothetical protein